MKKTLSTFGLLALASCQQQPAEAPPPPPPPPQVAPAPVEVTPPPPVAAAPKPAPATSAERTKLFQDCWVAFGAKDWAKFDPCYAEGATSEEVDSGMPVAVGRNEIIEKLRKPISASAPDQTGELELVLVNGNNIAAAVLIKGTNTGPIMTPGGELPPTKKKFGFLIGQSIETTEDGRAVAHDRLYTDGGTFMGQLGMAKMPHRPLLEKGWADKQVVVATGSDVEKANLAAAPKSLEAFNKHDVPTLLSMMTDDVVFSEAAAPADKVGKKAVEKSYKEMFKAFSDVKLEITRSWAAGDYVVWEGSFVGTNDGAAPSMGLPKATGKKVSSRFLEIDKIAAGKLKNIWVFDNGMAFASQLGMLPAPKPAAAPAPAKAAPVAAAAPATKTSAATPPVAKTSAPATPPAAKTSAPATPPAAKTSAPPAAPPMMK